MKDLLGDDWAEHLTYEDGANLSYDEAERLGLLGMEAELSPREQALADSGDYAALIATRRAKMMRADLDAQIPGTLSARDDLDEWQQAAERPERLNDWAQEREHLGLPIRDNEPSRKLLGRIWFICTGNRNARHEPTRIGQAHSYSIFRDKPRREWELLPHSPGGHRKIVTGRVLSAREEKALGDWHIAADLGRYEASTDEAADLDLEYEENGHDLIEFKCQECSRCSRISNVWNALPLNFWTDTKALDEPGPYGESQWEAPARLIEELSRARDSNLQLLDPPESTLPPQLRVHRDQD